MKQTALSSWAVDEIAHACGAAPTPLVALQLPDQWLGLLEVSGLLTLAHAYAVGSGRAGLGTSMGVAEAAAITNERRTSAVGGRLPGPVSDIVVSVDDAEVVLVRADRLWLAAVRHHGRFTTKPLDISRESPDGSALERSVLLVSLQTDEG
jgi:hypothetical protein